MAHLPNIIINDMANMLVAHGNKRKKDMFYPFNGMVAELTQINIQKALDGKLEVSLPWLDSGKGNPAIQSLKFIQYWEVLNICAYLTDYTKGM